MMMCVTKLDQSIKSKNNNNNNNNNSNNNNKININKRINQKLYRSKRIKQ
jgi:hypothetical protein